MFFSITKNLRYFCNLDPNAFTKIFSFLVINCLALTFISAYANADWKRIDPLQSKLSIKNPDSIFSYYCKERGWSKGYGYRDWLCRSERNSKNEFLVYYQKLATNRAFSNYYTIEQLVGNRTGFKNYGFGKLKPVPTGETTYDVYRSNRSDKNCYAFKLQDPESLGDNQLHGNWLIAGHFCNMPGAPFDDELITNFLSRISIDGLLDGRARPLSNGVATPRSESKDDRQSMDTKSSAESKLRELKKLFDKGLISKSKYDDKVDKILSKYD